jgi:hypothetical protein
MFYLLMLVYVQFMKMLIELQKVLSQELKRLCSKITSFTGMNPTKHYGCGSLIYIALQINT